MRQWRFILTLMYYLTSSSIPYFFFLELFFIFIFAKTKKTWFFTSGRSCWYRVASSLEIIHYGKQRDAFLSIVHFNCWYSRSHSANYPGNLSPSSTNATTTATAEWRSIGLDDKPHTRSSTSTWILLHDNSATTHSDSSTSCIGHWPYICSQVTKFYCR